MNRNDPGWQNKKSVNPSFFKSADFSCGAVAFKPKISKTRRQILPEIFVIISLNLRAHENAVMPTIKAYFNDDFPTDKTAVFRLF
ncbi:hypothetical protein [Kaistella palustris]|uniref:hypothetical protein n=1 Tax=Kaistella palustris TaxID=493376 RepID=UPI00146B2861|nr:hypothetical protein [Kaistella palustris]